MIQFCRQVGAGITLSFFLFPIGFTFLPPTLNTKLLLAVLGVLLLGLEFINRNQITFSKRFIGAFLFTLVFSGVCWFSSDYNQVIDNSYSTYFGSFLIWVLSAFTAIYTIKQVQGEVSWRILTYYLAAVCAMQCLSALLIDRILVVQLFVDSYIDIGQAFMQEVDRLYGLGAALDTAGVRFCVVLIMIAAIISKEERTRANSSHLILLLSAFFIIVVVGNMISRTTSVGSIMALGYLLLNTGLFRLVIHHKYFRFYAVFGVIFLAGIGLSIYLYQTDDSFYSNIRFAFEGFFNWVEKGEWETGSTTKLNEEMWVWPEDLQTWIIGSGRFGSFIYSTDIGYCRFILYCGLIGFSIFSLFFVYLAYSYGRNNKQYWDLFLMLLLLTFIIWIKVSTDLFFIYALLLSVDLINDSFTSSTQKKNENRLLYT